MKQFFEKCPFYVIGSWSKIFIIVFPRFLVNFNSNRFVKHVQLCPWQKYSLCIKASSSHPCLLHFHKSISHLSVNIHCQTPLYWDFTDSHLHFHKLNHVRNGNEREQVKNNRQSLYVSTLTSFNKLCVCVMCGRAWHFCHLSVWVSCVHQHQLSGNWVWIWGLSYSLSVAYSKTHSEITHFASKVNLWKYVEIVHTIWRLRKGNYLAFIQKWGWNTHQ